MATKVSREYLPPAPGSALTLRRQTVHRVYGRRHTAFRRHDCFFTPPLPNLALSAQRTWRNLGIIKTS